MTAIHEDKPLLGWYRFRKHREARWEPACIWEQGGKLVCRISQRMVDPLEVWTYLADNRVEKAAAKHCFDTGRWPDEPDAVQIPNLPADPYEALRAQIDAKTEQAERLIKQHPTVEDQATCNLFRNLQIEIQQFRKQADDMFKAEKQPHLDAGRVVDQRYRFRVDLEVAIRKLGFAYGAYMAAEEQRRIDAQRAEQARLDAERAQAMDRDPALAMLEEAPVAAPVEKVQAGGLYGRKAGLTDQWCTEVEDYAKAVKYFLKHPKLRAVVDELTQHVVKDAKGAIRIPGVKITLKRIAK